jgi:hypothetical protein
MTLINSPWKRCLRQVMYNTMWIFHPRLGSAALQELRVFRHPEVLWTQSFGGFMEVSSCRQDWLCHRSLVINLPFISSCTLDAEKWSWKPQSPHQVSLLLRSASTMGNLGVPRLSSLPRIQELRSYVAEIKYTFLIIWQYHSHEVGYCQFKQLES